MNIQMKRKQDGEFISLYPTANMANIIGTLSIANGGTGATDAATARANLEITPANIGAAPTEHTHDTLNISQTNVMNLANGYDYSEGTIWFNYTGANSAISSYILGNGQGSQLGTIIHSGNIGSQSVNYAASAGNADTVDGYHSSGLWTSDGGTWNAGANITCSGTGTEWSFDVNESGSGDSYWHVWSTNLGSSMIECHPIDGRVVIPHNLTVSGTLNGGTPITSANIGSQSVNYANSAGTATSATSASYIGGCQVLNSDPGSDCTYSLASNGGSNPIYWTHRNNKCVGHLARSGDCSYPMTFYWSGQGGQPNWIWGGNDSDSGLKMYVYNPSNFSVNYANSANAATYSYYTGNGDPGSATLKNIYSGTGAMTSGSTGLTSGVIYLQYT